MRLVTLKSKGGTDLFELHKEDHGGGRLTYQVWRRRAANDTAQLGAEWSVVNGHWTLKKLSPAVLPDDVRGEAENIIGGAQFVGDLLRAFRPSR